MSLFPAEAAEEEDTNGFAAQENLALPTPGMSVEP